MPSCDRPRKPRPLTLILAQPPPWTNISQLVADGNQDIIRNIQCAHCSDVSSCCDSTHFTTDCLRNIHLLQVRLKFCSLTLLPAS